MRKILLALLIVMGAASFAAADTIYLRDGRTVHGTLLGFINGRFVVRVDTRYVTPSGGVLNAPASPDRNEEIQYFRPSEVERIEIDGRSLDDLRFETRNVEVMLGSNWIDSGVDVRRGERIRIDASGTIYAGRSRITPEGMRTTDPTAPLPRANEGELIGTIGDDPRAPILELGSSREFVTDRDGRLYLTLNRGSYTDARGSFNVQIRRERDLNVLDQNDPGRLRPGRVRPREPVETVSREVTINVPGTSRGTDTNIDVRSGDQITFASSGRVVAGRRIGEVGPEGAASSGIGAILGTRPVATAGAGALIGYIRMVNGQMSQPFLIGNQLSLTVPADGRLFLAINDDNYSDNGGSFSVRIRY